MAKEKSKKKPSANPFKSAPVSKAIGVRSVSRSGFWRCSMHFGPEPITLSVAALAPGVLEILKCDPNLIVTGG